MFSLHRRTFLASSAALALGGTASVASAKPPSNDETACRMKVSDAVGTAGRCVLPRSVASALGVANGQQIRLASDDGPALFTARRADDKFGAVNPGGRDRLGATKNSFRATGDAQVVHPTMDRETAADTGEFIERHVAGNSEIIAIAPHGGYIEYGTDLQAMRFADRLDATAWYCSGWWPGGGAYRRWHVTSTDIDPRSFPELAAIQDVGFGTAVSFHGWGESFLAVGGTAPLALRTEIRDALADAVGGAFDVRLATDPARNGTDPDNVVNWLTASTRDGVQLEQPIAARTEHRNAITDAVADVVARHVA